MKGAASVLQLLLSAHHFFSAYAFGCKRCFASYRLPNKSSPWNGASRSDDSNSVLKSEEEFPLCRFQGCSDFVASRRGFLVLSSSIFALGTLSRQFPFSSSTKTVGSEVLPFSTVRQYKSIQLSNGVRCVLVSNMPYDFLTSFSHYTLC